MLQGLETALKLPDLWQQQAVRALKDGRDVVVDAPTGAGKTWVFELYIKDAKFGRSGKGQAVFTVPTRALANDKWREWKREGWNVGIATGDLAENVDAPVVVATLETQRERVIRGEGPALLVIDEYQMIADENRGLNYELVIALSPPETQLLLLSGSVANPREIVGWLERIGREGELVSVGERPVPLDDEALDGLPGPPRQVGGFWPSLGARTVLAGLSPLLIFVPQRAGAEKVAKKIAAVFPEDDPIELPPDKAALVSKEMARLLRRRVAYHHSGLSYTQRAAVIEPLAKKGQLRVIVATMGLAAGINFSVRTVFVADTLYRDGPFQKQLRPDELLQMFGRAGRRGLDESGHVLISHRSPRLMDGAPRKLRRVNEIDWPTLLRVMDRASDAGRDPFEAAKDVCGRLFSGQTIRLGIERKSERAHSEREKKGFNLGPRRKEILNSKGEWEPSIDLLREDRPLGACRVRVSPEERTMRALRSRDLVRGLGKGSLCKIRRDQGFDYGLEWKVARVLGDGRYKLLGWVKSETGWDSGPLSPSDFQSTIAPKVEALAEGGRSVRTVQRRGLVALQIDFAERGIEATIDSHGVPLADPVRRETEVEVETSYQRSTGDEIDAHPDSAAHAWRSLGLVERDGTPTLRGKVFSFFHSGEGLMIAAGLEDANYPVEELAWHLANLRAGFRFGEGEDGESSRFSAVARSAYGLVDYPGYLSLGLTPGYGEGAAEIVRMSLLEKQSGTGLPGELFSKGDVERAIVEWFSLLRHVLHAPVLEWPRWMDLKDSARQLLDRFKAHRSVPMITELPLTILNHRVRARLAHRDFGRSG